MQGRDRARAIRVLVDAAGGLMNVVVHVAAGLEGYAFPAASGAASMGQNGCIYDPHVVALRTGQGFKIEYDAKHMRVTNSEQANEYLVLINIRIWCRPS